jgi:putative redox protein
VDEPAQDGGDDAGPTPYELLLGALGACTAITLQLYARRHGWPLEGVEVRLEHSRRHARDCADCAERDLLLELIDKQIELHGPLSEPQRERLLQIADRCPVQRTLRGDVAIVSAESLAYADERRVPGD